MKRPGATTTAERSVREVLHLGDAATIYVDGAVEEPLRVTHSFACRVDSFDPDAFGVGDQRPSFKTGQSAALSNPPKA